MLSRNTLVQARVRAVNGLAEGDYSELNTDESAGVAFAYIRPETPTLAPIRWEALTTTTTIAVLMPEILANSDEAGGNAVEISAYNLEWNGGSGTTFTEVVGGTSDNTDRLIPVTTEASKTYLFRYRVKNIFGWSPGYSPVVSILSAKIPD